MTSGPGQNVPAMSTLIERFKAARQAASESAPPGQRQLFQGKLTFLGIAISMMGALGSFFGVSLPVQEVRDIADWFQAHWDTLTQLAGLVMAAYGRLRINWRKGDA